MTQPERLAQGWLLDGDIRQHSRRTLQACRSPTDRLLWFLRDRELPGCGTHELRAFLAHLSRRDEAQPARPRTIQTYHGHLSTLSLPLRLRA